MSHLTSRRTWRSETKRTGPKAWYKRRTSDVPSIRDKVPTTLHTDMAVNRRGTSCSRALRSGHDASARSIQVAGEAPLSQPCNTGSLLTGMPGKRCCALMPSTRLAMTCWSTVSAFTFWGSGRVRMKSRTVFRKAFSSSSSPPSFSTGPAMVQRSNGAGAFTSPESNEAKPARIFF